MDTSATRIGLLGGTFDPPHYGHLWLAELAHEQLRLDRVLFMPVGDPPHKRGHTVLAAEHRLAMVELAIGDNPRFAVDLTDMERAPPHTTYSLLPLVRSSFVDARFWMLIGSDSLRDLPLWREPHQVTAFCRLAVLPRPGVTIDWKALEAAVPTIKTSVDLLQGPSIDISSTVLRLRASSGHSLRYLVPREVLAYINDSRIYL
jgi:nicotinate-nucleotide adenylyltransferase